MVGKITRRAGVLAVAALLGSMTLGSVFADAAAPEYNGMSFPAIAGPSDPEEYSWEVRLGEGQELLQKDDRNAEVYWEDGTPAFQITAGLAHDSEGTNVPTSLVVSEGNIVTLIVHHRAGNPAASGAPFDYPITEGVGWEGGFHTYQVEMPPPEPLPLSQPPVCVVPKLKGLSLKADRRILRQAGCRLGSVRGQRSRTARAVRQSPRPGRVLQAGSEVGVKLG